ncbi:LysE family translocator [Deminuibacter soli]|uniref:Lysine transporter LysE n=1 Tax=Deminuibacter soli TaxID=2291815 RepID=A0A3E1NJV5_9BACT|nr:LysE family transporter [Deminuibacter soli]RFM28068.1 hypothetical protein DXN05_11070 [Deminuibacter soli]
MHLIFIASMGWLLSFLGQLPLGTMSITATQITVQESFRNAWKYAIGVTIVEVIYLRLVLYGVDGIRRHETLFSVLGWLTVVFFLALAIWSIISIKKDAGEGKEKKAMLLNNKLNRFLLGLSMSALNPAQIPFWFIWTSYFLDTKVLQSDATQFNFFSIGAGIGTISGLTLYMYGGNWLITKLKTSNRTLNKIMAAIFVIAAAAQIWRMLTR